MSERHNGFLVREHRPWRFWLALFLVLVLLVIAFLLGRAWQDYELDRLRLSREVLQNRVAELEMRNKQLVKRNAQLESSARIEGDASEQARQSLVVLQKEILDLKEQLMFYKGIVSPEKQALGVNIQSFTLHQRNDMGLYGYKLVLTKQGKSNVVVKGRIDLRIMGVEDSIQKSLDLKSAKPDYKEKDSRFSFRYFQVFEGAVQLPKDFEPYEVVIEIRPATRKVKAFTENLAWTKALNGGDNP